ncbi:hypothetical protein Ddye_021810 [Dipteronia dyeriana]|uniref:Serine-rich protein-like protein n=1 Tax=Dipteronia dyeriana TaxID=168575 RepID=A0AAD9U3D4_9ROSI|nr:hypothetical protein Ddye_021810 [Dipteronia dyeriana]
MAAASSRRSSSGPVTRSVSPSGRFCNSHYTSSMSSSSSAFAYSSSSFSARSATFFNRSASPNKPAQTTSAHSVRFVSPNRSNSITSTSSRNNQILKNHTATATTTSTTKQKRTCMCSPTTHPGSFRCSLHKNNSSPSSNYSPNNRLDARRSAMKNSLVRIGGVEGDLVQRALAALIRPSSHQQKRRAGFQQRPSRLSNMSKAEDNSS